jgi:shikimate dehydrogenase
VRPAQLADAIRAIRALGLSGVNVTIPHKEAVVSLLDGVAETAQRIGSVNTIERDGERLIGHNTDGLGFVQSLAESGVDPAGFRVILLGAGGAARGVADALLMAGALEMIILTRSPDRGSALIERLTPLFPHVTLSLCVWTNLPRPTLLVNATPLGMGAEDPLPYPAEQISPEWVVADLIYRPHKTAFLTASEARGAKIVPGIGMLLHQGALAFEIWTRKPAPLSIMRQALEVALTAL